jgi:predicted amidophosphoribosyltransferase
MKICPECARSISRSARVCPHCGRQFHQVLGVIALTLLVVFGYGLFHTLTR